MLAAGRATRSPSLVLRSRSCAALQDLAEQEEIGSQTTLQPLEDHSLLQRIGSRMHFSCSGARHEHIDPQAHLESNRVRLMPQAHRVVGCILPTPLLDLSLTCLGYPMPYRTKRAIWMVRVWAWLGASGISGKVSDLEVFAPSSDAVLRGLAFRLLRLSGRGRLELLDRGRGVLFLVPSLGRMRARHTPVSTSGRQRSTGHGRGRHCGREFSDSPFRPGGWGHTRVVERHVDTSGGDDDIVVAPSAGSAVVVDCGRMEGSW